MDELFVNSLARIQINFLVALSRPWSFYGSLVGFNSPLLGFLFSGECIWLAFGF